MGFVSFTLKSWVGWFFFFLPHENVFGTIFKSAQLCGMMGTMEVLPLVPSQG